jgi:hypothetical protein
MSEEQRAEAIREYVDIRLAEVAQYAEGPVGRPTSEDILGLIRGVNGARHARLVWEDEQELTPGAGEGVSPQGLRNGGGVVAMGVRVVRKILKGGMEPWEETEEGNLAVEEVRLSSPSGRKSSERSPRCSAWAAAPTTSPRSSGRLMETASASPRQRSAGSRAGGLPAGVSVRERLLRCGREGCSGCPHGPYVYVRIRREGERREVSLGTHPGRRAFYERLTEYLDGEEIRAVADYWKEEHDREKADVRDEAGRVVAGRIRAVDGSGHRRGERAGAGDGEAADGYKEEPGAGQNGRRAPGLVAVSN